MSLRVLSWAWERLEYSAEAGGLIWKDGPRAGRRAGTITSDGYRSIFYKGKGYREHRLVMLLATGEMPDGQVDHINRIRDDNRIENLRVVTPLENVRNRVFGERRYH